VPPPGYATLRAMAVRPNMPEEIDPLWRDLCEKILDELRRRGIDVDAMSDTEFAELCQRIAQVRPAVTEHAGWQRRANRGRPKAG